MSSLFGTVAGRLGAVAGAVLRERGLDRWDGAVDRDRWDRSDLGEAGDPGGVFEVTLVRVRRGAGRHPQRERCGVGAVEPGVGGVALPRWLLLGAGLSGASRSA
ncbi:hypothetical protein Psuf_039760 [Phytohabitans suffuscus]|uniref:Uncharacterized protein n=1 Tax=Phytohabitans suffuscus TaxID=624315 RepID=A0A6F8YKU3_9ACTN|nr:hypothetical protein [Phytohabitans suffuscus]BCB86663.1 hypothetical protein Psuf_039760 [Phytohabitans suffuscus]